MPRVVGLALGFGLAELAAKKNDEGVRIGIRHPLLNIKIGVNGCMAVTAAAVASPSRRQDGRYRLCPMGTGVIFACG
jgi:hypothetical protein